MRQEGGGSREFKLHSVGVHHLVRELDTSRGCGGIDGYPRLKDRIRPPQLATISFSTTSCDAAACCVAADSSSE